MLWLYRGLSVLRVDDKSWPYNFSRASSSQVTQVKAYASDSRAVQNGLYGLLL